MTNAAKPIKPVSDLFDAQVVRRTTGQGWPRGVSEEIPAKYRIGEFTLSLSTNELTSSDGTRVLEPLSAELLAYLARRAGEVVSLDDLFNDLWKGQYVTENSIYRQVAQLRSLLGDDAKKPEYIQTVRKRGYRLIAPVNPADTPATPITVHRRRLP